MATLLPFRPRRQSAAAYVLALSARWKRLSKTKPWTHAPAEPEHLGNMLQHLTTREPELVFVLQNIVAEILTLIHDDD